MFDPCNRRGLALNRLHSRYFNDNCFQLWCQISVSLYQLVNNMFCGFHYSLLLSTQGVIFLEANYIPEGKKKMTRIQVIKTSLSCLYTRLCASWIEQSFAMPSTLPTALVLTSYSALLFYSLRCSFSPFSHAEIHVKSKSAMGEETKRTYKINM